VSHALGYINASQVTTGTLADVLRTVPVTGAVNAPASDLRAVLDTNGHTGAVSMILTTGDAVGGCDYTVYGTCDDPKITASPVWAIATKQDSTTAASGTVAASTSSVIFEVDHSHFFAYKVAVKYHTASNAQSVTLIGVAKS